MIHTMHADPNLATLKAKFKGVIALNFKAAQGDLCCIEEEGQSTWLITLKEELTMDQYREKC